MEFRSACAQQTISGMWSMKRQNKLTLVKFYKTITEYSCHGSWEENGISYVITSPVARKSTDALRYCFIYTLSNHPMTTVIEGSLGKKVEPPVFRVSSVSESYNRHIIPGVTILSLSGVSESCHRHIIPGVTGNWAFNFTSNGKTLV